VGVTDLQEHENSSHGQKRRFTDYYFKLLRHDSNAPISLTNTRQSLGGPATNTRQAALDADGIPVVRTTQPDDEIEDFKRLRTEQLVRLKASSSDSSESTSIAAPELENAPSAPLTDQVKSLQNARRFYLARSLSSFYRPDLAGGIRKPSTRLRPTLATFVERHGNTVGLDSTQTSSANLSVTESRATQIPTTQVKANNKEKTAKGRRVILNQPLSSWDTNSDELADELAALAMEIEPVDHQKPKSPAADQSATKATPDADIATPNSQDFVLETYVRVLREDLYSSDETPTMAVDSIGILVIDQEDEDLWQAYLEEDGESDWDDEDSNGKCLLAKHAIRDSDHPQLRTTPPTTIQRMRCPQTMSLIGVPTTIDETIQKAKSTMRTILNPMFIDTQLFWP
jgi:hypothetical protein